MDDTRWDHGLKVTGEGQGLSYAEISAELNCEGIPTPAGRPVWHKSYVDRLLHTQYAQEIWGHCANAPLEMASTK
jgi:hypothetical protein